jgi:hypothetical protein
VRTRVLALTLAAVATACTHAPSSQPGPQTLSIVPVASTASPSPLVEVRIGLVRAVIPRSWDARTLPTSKVPTEGFVASPDLAGWEHGAAHVQGIEAFWVDIGRLQIPTDYYYLAAKNASFGQLDRAGRCGRVRPTVLANHPPDYTGQSFSPGDFVASAAGRCVAGGRPTHWAYMVAAPGFGPLRHIGIPTSGLYVVVADVAGPRSATMLDEMMRGARFSSATVAQLLQAAHQPNA